MKRVLIFIMLILTVLMSGCSVKNVNNEKLNIICTTFPQYDWSRTIMGENNDNCTLTLLLDSGVDMHSYEPSVDDIVKITSCDILIYNGGQSEKWIDDALKEKKNKNMTVINLMEKTNVKEETDAGIVQSEEEQDGQETDEHIWLSVKNAQKFAKIICDALKSANPETAKTYENNLNSYLTELEKLDNEYKKATENARLDTVIVCDRFPMRYLFDDYKIKYFAAFPGCSAETEASFETVIELSKKADELNVPVVLTMEKSDKKLAKTVMDNSSKSRDILELDSMQSVTKEDLKSGITYIDVMNNNLNVLKKALGE